MIYKIFKTTPHLFPKEGKTNNGADPKITLPKSNNNNGQ